VLTASESLLCGLATLSKLNGGIAAPIVVSVLVLGTWLAGRRSRTTESNRRLDGRNLMAGPVVALAIGAGSFLVFLGLNPFLTARPALPSEASSELRELAASGPIGRTRFLLDFRRGWARDARQNAAFQKDWLPTMTDRLRMTVWEGFGRFSTLGPREIRTITIKDFDTNERDGRLRPNELPEWIRGRFNRIDTDRDGTVDKDELAEFLDGAPPLYLYGRSASLIWLPLVLLGVAWSARAGWSRYRAGGPPHPWVMLLYTVAVVAVVVLLIPLNWDRYYLPMQPCAALLVPCGIAATLRWVGGRLVLQPAPVRVD
jgi:4-amino-4-deoxy-L-arabinose transferase-like glycosyltransferase